MFDEDEKWRPLSIPEFFGEGQEICYGGNCEPIDDPSQLEDYPYASAELQVLMPEGATQYQSEYSECITTELLDCDSGPRTKIYWHKVSPSPLGYDYFDYWAYYRYNEFNVVGIPAGDHQSDWEGVTVAPAPNDATFDFAAFSQHGPYYSYLRENLDCGEGEGSCGPRSRHVSSYVAAGSHANYAEPCSGPCTQTNPAYPWEFSETQHGGEAPWGRTRMSPR